MATLTAGLSLGMGLLNIQQKEQERLAQEKINKAEAQRIKADKEEAQRKRISLIDEQRASMDLSPNKFKTLTRGEAGVKTGTKSLLEVLG